jgi:hypothetical protein
MMQHSWLADAFMSQDGYDLVIKIIYHGVTCECQLRGSPARVDRSR